jgi:hypothetical protein
MMYGDYPTILRLRPCAPGGEEPRPHPKAAHPPSVVAQVRHLVTTTPYTYRDIAVRTGVNNGTVARWAEKYGWTRPPGAWPKQARPERRYLPVMIGRALAMRLRRQAERLLCEIEAAPTADAAALAEALALLERARAEQQIRRTKKRRPPDPAPADAPNETPERPELDGPTRLRIRETRSLGGYKSWGKRWATQAKPPKWTRAGGAGEREAKERLRYYMEEDRDLPSPHLHPVTKPAYSPCKWDRRAAALRGWKRRYARMEGREG